MIVTSRIKHIYLASYKVDFRKQHNGFLAEAFRLNLNPYNGDILIFIGRKRDTIKVLYSDATGLWLSVKKFTVEIMKTKFRFISDPFYTKISEGELALLLEGAAYTVEKKLSTYELPKRVDKVRTPA